MKNLNKFEGKEVKYTHLVKGGKTGTRVAETSNNGSGSTIAHETGHWL